jgi:NitT/TauT family transport system substrate-binding protein
MNTWPGYEPLYLAERLGYYKTTAIDLHDYPSATAVRRAFLNRELEVAALTLDETLSIAEIDPSIQIILVTDFSNGADVILAKPEIQKLQELKGKRIGVETTALGAYLIIRALEKARMRIQDVEILPLELSGHEAAFVQGNVDAIVTFEPVRSKLLKVGAKILFDSSQIPGEIVDVLVIRKGMLEKQQAAVKTLIEGWFQALTYMKQNPQDAARQMAAREGIPPDKFLASLELIQIPSLTDNQNLLGKVDPTLSNSINQLAAVMVENKLLKKASDLSPLLNDVYVKPLSVGGSE